MNNKNLIPDVQKVRRKAVANEGEIVTVYVDKDAPKDQPQTGSRQFPFRTLQAAVNHAAERVRSQQKDPS